MVYYKLDELAKETSVSADIYLDEQFLLLPADVPLAEDLYTGLTELGIEEVLIAAEEGEIRFTKTKAEAEKEAANAELIPSQEAFRGKSSAEQVELCMRTYEKLCNYIHDLFVATIGGKTLSPAALERVMEKLVEYVKVNRRMVLHVPMRYEGEDGGSVQVHHSAHCTVLSILVGLQLGLQPTHLVELGMAALLHELGMFYLTGDLYRKEEQFLPLDKREMQKHSNIAANLLIVAGFPPTVYGGVLQHHERENGTGYPQQLRENHISIFGKILAVVCAYEALSSHRSYRNRMTPHQALQRILADSGKLYDSRITRVLLTCLSLFPIGTLVALTDGRLCRVVEVNPKDPRCPILATLNEDWSEDALILPDNVHVVVDREVSREEARKIRLLGRVT